MEIMLDHSDIQKFRISTYFQQKYLLSELSSKHHITMTKRDRLEKWWKMITWGLNESLVSKTIAEQDLIRVQKFDSNDIAPIEFTSYALVGLKNFYSESPELFISRLAKGPPPQYRWLAWRFITNHILNKSTVGKGVYEKQIKKGRKKANSVNKEYIRKDINRTFPDLEYFAEDFKGQ